MFKAVAEVMALGIFVFFLLLFRDTDARESGNLFRPFVYFAHKLLLPNIPFLFICMFPYLFACLFIYPLMSLQIYFNSAEFNKVKS